MNALAFLLGARALGLARHRGPAGKPIAQLDLPPIASTEETAMAWRRWAQAGDPLVALASQDVRLPASPPVTAEPTRSPA
jgi:hypothetical protein